MKRAICGVSPNISGMNKRFRLRRSQDFERVRRDGSIYRHPFLVLSLAPNELTYNRYGFITSKKLGKAVVRNRVRRLLRESVRLLHADLEPGFDVVMVARVKITGQPLAEVKRATKETLRRAGLLVTG